MDEQRTPNPAASDRAVPSTWTEPGIVVGIDGSESSRTALEYAAWLAPQMQLPLHALVVWEDPAIMWGDAYGYYGPSIEETEANARQLAKDEVVRLFPHGAPAWLTTDAVRGSAASTLIETSRAAAMLVVGSRGHGGFTGLLLGSVSSACVAHAHCPVLVARETAISAPRGE